MSNLFDLVMVWVVTIDPGSVVLGMIMAHAVMMVTDSWRARRNAQPWREKYQWNRPEVLPPVDCPLVLNILGEIAHGERISHLSDRGGVMDYRLSTGQVIRGRFAWSYP